jgi:hypothetical protein
LTAQDLLHAFAFEIESAHTGRSPDRVKFGLKFEHAPAHHLGFGRPAHPEGVIAARGLPKKGQLTRSAVLAEDEKMIGAVAAVNPDTMVAITFRTLNFVGGLRG